MMKTAAEWSSAGTSAGSRKSASAPIACPAGTWRRSWMKSNARWRAHRAIRSWTPSRCCWNTRAKSATGATGQAETRKAQKHLEELKEEERKVKARTQSASRKEANVAVEAERARTERARLDTIEIAREVAVFARRIEALQTRGPRKDPRTPEEGSNHGRS
jgi:hypothetical protein